MDVIVQKVYRNDCTMVIISSVQGTHVLKGHDDSDFIQMPLEYLADMRYSETDLDMVEGRVF